MKRKGDIADFFVKRHKSGPDQAQADPTPKTSSPGSSQPGASQASQCEHREGSSLPPPGCLVCSSVNSIGIDKEQGVSLSREWMNFEIQVSGQGSRTTSLSILRNKVRKHALSKAHTQAVKVAEQQKEAAIENAVETMTESYMKETEAVFRTAYHLAKKNRPFSDHESLIELQELNGELQSRSITLLGAEHLLKRSIRVIQSFKESPGEKYSEALEAKQTGEYRSIALKTNAKLKSINPGQFLQSLVNNLEKRLSFEDETIMDLSILDQSKWPSKPSIRHGEEQVKRLCKRFNLCTDQALNGMRDLLEEPSSEPKDLKPLMNCMKTFPVGTAECERNFSLMNNISSDKRAVLLISNISNLMMININGPPTSKFDPRKYTRTWLKSHRAASSVRSRQCSVKAPAESKFVWNIL
ncbi:unnamed protein product [Coregonus sp. 'balchen']|nr:unnamed protein product [Coregonus sp. 'balchen']